VDLGPLTLARASVALEQGRLITKREALDVLAGLGAPSNVLRDIYQRLYEAERPISIRWRIKRGYLARAFVRAGIDRILSREKKPKGPRSIRQIPSSVDIRSAARLAGPGRSPTRKAGSGRFSSQYV